MFSLAIPWVITSLPSTDWTCVVPVLWGPICTIALGRLETSLLDITNNNRTNEINELLTLCLSYNQRIVPVSFSSLPVWIIAFEWLDIPILVTINNTTIETIKIANIINLEQFEITEVMHIIKIYLSAVYKPKSKFLLL